MKKPLPSDNLTYHNAFKQAKLPGKMALILATWFGTGLMPWAPGTFGTLAALPVVAVLCFFGPVVSGIAFIILFYVATWSSETSRILLKKDDPSEVVIDEAAGLLLTMYLLPLTWQSLLLGFILFRLFDIWKPFPIRWIDRKIKGGIGIVLDDLVAGIFANLCVRGILFLI